MTIKVFPNLDKMWYPFVGVCVILGGFEISSSLIRGLRVQHIPWILKITVILYAIIGFVTFLFFVITGSKVLKTLLATKAVNASRTEAVKVNVKYPTEVSETNSPRNGKWFPSLFFCHL